MEDGGPAFPKLTGLRNTKCDSARDDYYAESKDGMSLRDWFAGMALQGFLSSPYDFEDDKEGRGCQKLVKSAYVYADLMLREKAEYMERERRMAKH